MAEALFVFAIQVAYVFLLGLQSRNVRDSQYLAAAATSTMLGMAGLMTTTAIAKSVILGGSSVVGFAYVAGGPCGICLAMWLHDRVAKWKISKRK